MLNTMSFIEALPAFRMKQWQVIALLFIEGLSVCRIPALTPRMTNRRVLIHKVKKKTFLCRLIVLFISHTMRRKMRIEKASNKIVS